MTDDNLKSIFDEFSKLNKDAFKEGSDIIRYAGPYLDKSDLKCTMNSLLDGFKTGWLGFGKYAKQFEIDFAKFLGRKFAIFTNSGSSANLLAIGSLISLKKLQKNDEIITIAATFPTTINPLILYGLKPVLVDVVFPSYTINIEQLKKAISSKTKAIFLPHISGSPHNMLEIQKIAKKSNLLIIEDCCDALNSKINNRAVGTFGLSATFSFYVAHHITSGEGGMIVTDDLLLANNIRSLRDWGRMPLNEQDSDFKLRKKQIQNISKNIPDDYEARYTYSTIGYNLKPIDMQGALGSNQLKKIEKFSKIRNKNYDKLFSALSKYSSIILPKSLPNSYPSWFVFPITINDNATFSRNEISNYLESNKIETRPMLAGNITKHPAYADIKFKIIGNLTNTEKILSKSFSVGVYPGIDKNRINYMIKIFQNFLGKHEK